MPIPNTLHQPIAFGDSSCFDDAQPIVIGNIDQCPGIPNANLEGNPVTEWTILNGTQSGTNPFNITYAVGVASIAQIAFPLLGVGEFTISWSITNNSAKTLLASFGFTTVGGGLSRTFNDSIAAGATSTQSENFIIPNEPSATGHTLIVTLDNLPTGNIDADIIYINICPTNASNLDFCFQLPMFQTGSELLGLNGNTVSLAYNFIQDAGYASTVDVNNGSCVASPASPNRSFSPVCQAPATLGAEGQYYMFVDIDSANITYGKNPYTEVEQRVLLRAYDGSNLAELGIGNQDSDTQRFALSEMDFLSTDQPELVVRAQYQCDGTDDRHLWDIDVTSFSMMPNFYEDTFTAEDDTFYRLRFDLSKTSSVNVQVTDSSGTTIFEASETGAKFDRIFLTGTLPTTTVTVRFEVNTIDEWPDANFNTDILTNVTIYKYCKWSIEAQDLTGATIKALDETHATATTSPYTVAYNRNVLYCLDTQNIDAGCLVLVATNDCNSTEEWTSNRFQICEGSCNVNRIDWDHGGYKYIGEERLDYTNYDYDTFFFVKTDFQDLTQEWEGTYYRDARYGLKNPYSAYASTEVMVVWPLPGFMRNALAIATSSEFYVDGTQYKKLDDESITPDFNARGESSTRMVVQKTGNHVQSKN